MPDYVSIPKPVLVCDACNTLLADEEGKVYKNCNWNEWGLVCDSHDMKDLEVYERFNKDNIIPKSHYIWTPMKIVFYDKDEEMP